METVKGRYKLASGSISSAGFWVPRFEDGVDTGVPQVGEFVPRPDRNIDTLKMYSWLGILGLDHFYLRSPATGIAKLLTMGGFLFWWLWDLIQVHTERERVLNYGLSAPFDAVTGIGQGMMYELPQGGRWNYSQMTDFSTWAFATLFGFLGLDMFLLGRFWLGFRKLIIFMITVSAIAPFMTKFMAEGLWSSIYSVGIFGLLWLIFCFMLAVGLGTIWLGDISTLMTHPDTIMKKGMPISQTAVDSLSWIKKLYLDEEGNVKPELQREWDTVNEHYNFQAKGIVGQELQGRFWIAHGDEKPVLPAQGSIPGVIPLTLFWRMTVNFFMWIVTGVIALWQMTPWGRAAAVAGRSAALLEKTANEVAQGVAAAKGVVNEVAQGVAAAKGTLEDVQSKGLDQLADHLTGHLSDVQSKGLDHLTGHLSGAQSKGIGLSKKFHRGGAHDELSVESQVMGATILALIIGGSLKGLIDSTMTQ